MGVQLPLPAQWARLVTAREPRDQLSALRLDVVEAKAEIRKVLDRLAARHGISARDVTYAMESYADSLLADTVYHVERDLTHEIEANDLP
jgi:hypothetical protein